MWGVVAAAVAVMGIAVLPPQVAAAADQPGGETGADHCAANTVCEKLQFFAQGIRNRYNALGGASSSLGLPTSEKTEQNGGFYQQFERAAILWGPGTGPKIITNQALEAWKKSPKRYGWAVADSREEPERGTVDTFQRFSVVTASGQLWVDRVIGAEAAVILCDSQCDGQGWPEQGARAAGFTRIVERSFGGGGYSAISNVLGTSVTQAFAEDRFLLPQGNPGVVLLTLGGNDASQGRSDADIRAGLDRMVAKARTMYPSSRIVVNGVMSRGDADHARRRAVDQVVTQRARELGLSAISVAGWGSTYRAEYLDDVHPSQLGHDTLAAPYGEALSAVVRSA